MALQQLINIGSQLDINRRRLVGVQMTRNELSRVSETPTYQPWKFTLSVPNIPYSSARQIIEDLDTMDKVSPEVVTFSANAGMKWMFSYQGTLDATQRAAIYVQSFTGNQLVLNVSLVNGETAGDVILEKGDFIQIEGYPFPFTSRTTVLRGTGSTVTVTTHRPNIFGNASLSALNLLWGNDVTFKVFCPNMPYYTLIPGAAKFNPITKTVSNNAIVQWSSSFQLVEYVAGI